MKQSNRWTSVKAAIAIGGLGLLAVGCSYLSELPKHQFERDSASFDQEPGTRLIDTVNVVDIGSPYTLFRPRKEAWRYAVPDLIQPNRFGVISARYQSEPVVFLVDVECESRDLYFAGLDEPETAAPLRDVLGREVRAGDGRIFRVMDTTEKPDPKLLAAFCDTSWDSERTELRTAAGTS